MIVLKPCPFCGGPPAAAESNDSVEAEFPAWTEEDKAYELGRRDGYELAVQDIDLATGGDGEFKGSTLPGETVDVETMKQRVIERFGNASAEARLRRAILDVLNSVAPAAENLACNQEQADMDGCMVKVPRQALDEVLAAVNEVAIQAATSGWPAVGDEAKKSEGDTTKIKIPLPSWLGPDTPENRERLQAFVEGRNPIADRREIVTWLPMGDAPRDQRYIAALPKTTDEPIIVYWSIDANGWWLPEGALFQDSHFVGWTPLPE